jgi:hypothetical protein
MKDEKDLRPRTKMFARRIILFTTISKHSRGIT